MVDTYPTEQWPSDADAIALGGTTDEATGLPYIERGADADDSPRLEVQMQRRLERANEMLEAPNAGRVVADGSLTIGVFPFDYTLGGTAKRFAGAETQSVNDDDTSYVYIDSSNALQIVTDATGWPADIASYWPLAEVAAASGVITAISDVRGRGRNAIPPVVSAGDGLDLAAGVMSVKLVDATLTRSASGVGVNLAGIAGDGLYGDSGGLHVDADDIAGEGLESSALDLRVKLDGSTIARSASGIKVSATDLAGDGLQADGDTVEVDASAIAGTGLEDDGAENLRIAAAAAGDGLEGGAGSALAVKLDGATIAKSASGVKVAVSEIAGAGLEDDGSENLRIAAAAAGDGLEGGAGSALAVKLDGATIAKSASGVKVADGGLAGGQLGNMGANGGIPVIFSAALTAGNSVAIHDANAPFKYRVIDAWSVATSADGGTWEVSNGTNVITDTVTVTATDKAMNRAGTIDDAYHEIAANGSLWVDGDESLTDVIVYVLAVRVA